MGSSARVEQWSSHPLTTGDALEAVHVQLSLKGFDFALSEPTAMRGQSCRAMG